MKTEEHIRLLLDARPISPGDRVRTPAVRGNPFGIVYEVYRRNDDVLMACVWIPGDPQEYTYPIASLERVS